MTKRMIGLIIGVILFLNIIAVGIVQDGTNVMSNNVYDNDVTSDEVTYVLWDMAHSNDGPALYSDLVNDLELIDFNITEYSGLEINASLLAQYNTIAIVQPRTGYSSIELTAIHDFVVNGGGLIVIGDHNETIMDSLTSFAGFDWIYTGSGLSAGPIAIAHPVTLGAESYVFPSWGLKINATWPAIGLKETTDGLHLMGAAQIGSGKVVCVTDDEIFRNSDIHDSDNFILGRNSFTWTSSAVRPHDVWAHARVFWLNVKDMSNPPITVSVLNTGTSVEEYVIVRLFIDGLPVFADVIPLLNTSTLIEYDYIWIPSESGISNVTVIVESVPGEDWLSDNVHSYEVEVLDWFIEIYSDADFVSQGWPGSGTYEDPYRLDNLFMHAVYSYTECIIIEDTSAHFVISNSSFEGEEVSTHDGIRMTNVTNGQIINNTFTHCRYGIWGQEVFSSNFTDNTFIDSWSSLWLGSSNHNNIIGNGFENNDDAVTIDQSHFNTFENNTLQNNIDGLVIEDLSNETKVRWNWFFGNDQNALDDGEFDIFFENYWSNYTGIDADFDNFGDTPHPIPGLADNYDTHPIALPFEGPYVTWNDMPTDQSVDIGEEVSVQLNASALAGIDNYWLNDTTYFGIDVLGILSNSSIVPSGSYALEIRIYDGYGHYCSAEITILVVDDVSPEWIVEPTQQIVELGTAWSYDLDALDTSGIDTWWLNDTSRFSINSDGVISMNYMLPVADYWLRVRVNDTAGNTLMAIFEVQIQDTQDPEWLYQPSNQQIFYGDALSYPVIAIDPSEIDYYWVNDTISFAIDSSGTISNLVSLDCGSYGLEIRAYDNHGHYCDAVIVISVDDGTLPSIDHPADIEYEEGDTGAIITWHPSDDNPVRYEIWRDGTLLRTGDWNSSSEAININVDGLSPEAYVFTVIVVDYGGHSIIDSVLVTVYETISPTTTTTGQPTTTTSTTSTVPPIEMMSLAIGLGVGVMATSVIIILVLVRKGLIRKT